METSKATILKALRLLFRPVARILLKAGINWKELVEVCKATYVEVATQDFGIRGRPTNVSRVAILTGFSRREVRRLRDLNGLDETPAFDRMNYATRVLSGWFGDKDFQDATGEPRPLAVSGCNPSFDTLCSRYSGDVPATAMLKELRHVGAVTETDDGRVLAKTRYYMPALTDPEQVLRSGSVLEDLGQTVAYNLHRSSEDDSRFERRATNTRIPKTKIKEFRQFVESEGQAFLERVDHWLIENEDKQAEETIRLGMGAYWIEGMENERARS